MNQNENKQMTPRRSSPSWQMMLVAAVLLTAGMLIGSTVSRPAEAQAEVINAAPAQHFLRGDQISVPILQDIAATLHQMDGRLARLESAAQQMQGKPNSSVKP